MTLADFIRIALCACLTIFGINAGLCQEYVLNGDAVDLGGGCYQLTAAQNTQSGTVWYSEQIDLTQPFQIDLTMSFGTNDGNGADGMVFVLQDVGTSAIGTGGGGMGYLGFAPSIGVEFDTWQNNDQSDPSYDHVALMHDGFTDHTSIYNLSGPNQADANSINIEDGEDHEVRFIWNPENNQFRVMFDCEVRIDATYDITTAFDSPFVWWGFTGATGGANNQQTICVNENTVSAGPNLTICEGASTVLSVNADPEGAFVWQPWELLDDPTAANPVATPLETTTFTVSYTDPCGGSVQDSVTVTVEELTVSIDDPVELDCQILNTQLWANTNFGSGVNYVWTTADGNIGQGPNNPNPTITEVGTYIVNVEFDSLCFAADTVLVTGNFDFELTADALDDLINCNQSETDIDADSNYNFGVEYTWETADGTIDSDPNDDEITVSSGGTYIVTGYLNDLCNDTFEVVIDEDFSVYDVDAGPEMVLNCYQDEVELLGSTTASDGITIWTTSNGNISGGFTSLTPDVDEAGTYTLTITNPTSGCDNSAETTVTEDYAIPEVNAGYADTLTCRDPMGHILDASHNVANPEISWSTPDGNILSGWTSISPHVDEPGTYTITVTNLDNGCENSASMVVVVSDNYNLDLSQLRIPNVISPGTDNKNDYFRMFLANDPSFDVSALMEEFSLNIYNRWGSLIYTSDGHVRSWDGRVSGEIPTPGTYYYILSYEIECGVVQQELVEGTIELLID